MDEEVERLIVSVRADTAAFARDVEAMRGSLEGPLASGADRAGRAIESGLSRAARQGALGFENLKRTALAALGEIAAASIRQGVGAVVGVGGVASALSGILSAAVGAPGRATGGPVAPGRPYWVGERGPELFVPGSAGRIEASGGGGAREVRVAITVNAAPGMDGAQALARSSRQVARAVKRAVEG